MQTVSCTQLHSRYNPQAEAVRYIDSLNLKDSTEYFILIEPGLGYIIPVIQEKFKTCKIIVLHIDKFPLPQECRLSEIPVLYSTEPAEIQKFLETHIPEIVIRNSCIIQWRPSLDFYKEAYVKLLSQVVDFLKRTDAENRTTAAFGKRWIRNFFRNIKNVNKSLTFRQSSIPVIVTGSGPGLEQSLPVIKEAQEKCLIIAASSSITALWAGGIKADIVISTDGGNWALRHLYPGIRHQGLSALAVNLCAALPSQCENIPFLIINDGSFWQNIVLHELAIPSVLISQKGTVSATAAELALQLSSGNIYLAGMDFSFNDLRTHAKPYVFDNLFFEHACRFYPVYSEIFTRCFLLRQGGSMNIYAAWFKNQLGNWPKRIFSIGEKSENSGKKIFEDGNSALKHEILKQKALKNTESFLKASAYRTDTGGRSVSALLSALKNPEYAENLKQELGSLLFPPEVPGEGSATEQDLETAIKEIA